MQNNPISKSDWLGNYFTWANSTVRNTYLRLREENSQRIKNYLSELSKLDLNSGEKSVRKQVSQLTELINSHAELNSQWNEMASSDVEFYVSSETPAEGAAADTKYSSSQNKVNIRLGKSDKSLHLMAHEFRHGYGYLNGEMVSGGNGLYDMTDEVVAYNAGYLFWDQNTAELVVDGYFNVDWFKSTQMPNSKIYDILVGRETSITLNTPAAVYLQYFNDRLANFMLPHNNDGNTNMTVQDAIDAANANSQQNKRGNEYRYGKMLKNRNQ